MLPATSGVPLDCHRSVGPVLQRKLVAAVLIAAMSLLSAPAMQNAHAEPYTTKVAVMARIAGFFRLQIDHQAAALTINCAFRGT